MQRVKVYRLTADGQWDDRGTGQVSVEWMEQSNTRGLIVISEDQDTRTLLIHEIQSQDIYQRQGEETIITWSDAEIGTDVALSFQETDGCNSVWKEIVEAQSHDYDRKSDSDAHFGNGGENGFLKRPGMVDEYDQQVSNHMDDRIVEYKPGAPGLELPDAELRNLPHIAKVMGDPRAREQLPPQITPAYLRKLLDVFQTCDDLEDEESLKHLYHIMKGAVMLNNNQLLELLLAEENVMDVVGALEHDPELAVRQNHRAFLREHVIFKEVVPITSAEMKERIHQTYRMGYIKDVILPRVLDDQTFAALQSVMLMNNVEILYKLQQDPNFFPELFKKLKTTPSKAEAWSDLVKFLQELCGLARHLQPNTRAELLGQLVSLGLFEVLTNVIRSGDPALQLRATDVMLSAIQHDPAPLRHFMRSQKDHELFHLLVSVLEFGPDQGLQGQVVDIVRMLLDPDSMDQSPEKDPFLELFYDKYVGELINLLIEGAEQNQQQSQEQVDAFRRLEQAASGGEGAGPGPSSQKQQEQEQEQQRQGGPGVKKHIGSNTMGMVLDLLCFCVQHHGYRIKSYILKRRLMPKLMKPIHCREKWLVIAAIRFLRTCISMKDEFYYRNITKENLFEPVFSVFLENGPRYNMLNSSVLELVDFIRKENIKTLVEHIVDQHIERLQGIEYVQTFKELKNKYEQNKESVVSAFASGPPNGVTAAAQRWRKDARALEREEEDYFNEEDDDDARRGPPRPSSPELHSEGVGRPFIKLRPGSPPSQRPPPRASGNGPKGGSTHGNPGSQPPGRAPPRRPDHGPSPRSAMERGGGDRSPRAGRSGPATAQNKGLRAVFTPLVDYGDDSDEEQGSPSSTGSGSKRPIGPQEASRDSTKRPKININTSSLVHQDHGQSPAVKQEQSSFWKRV
ncbi:hypothetical protein ABBQ38_008638 [Trebouxia sp. C0009 RCD-2024]